MPSKTIIRRMMASYRDMLVVDRLAEPGKDVNGKDPNDLTYSVILNVVTLGHFNVLQIPADPGAEANAGNGLGCTSLYCSVSNKTANSTDPLGYIVKDLQ